MKWITMYRYGHDLNDCYSNEMLGHNGMKINVWKCNTSRIASVVDKRSTHIYHMLFFFIIFPLSYSYIPLRVGYHCYYTSPEAKPRTSVNNNDILRV